MMPDLSAAIGLVLRAVLMSAASADDKKAAVGDARLRVALEMKNGTLTEQWPGAAGKAFVVEIDGKRFEPAGAALVSSAADRAVFEGNDAVLAWKLGYEVSGAGQITKSLEITPKKDMVLWRVWMWIAESEHETVVARTEMQAIAAFSRHVSGLPLRQDGVSGFPLRSNPETTGDTGAGLFASLDFPYSKIVCENGLTEIGYPPYVKLKAGQTYECHSLTVGATSLAGHARYGFDDGEVEAMDTYVQTRFKPRFDRPMFVSCDINNRYTQLDGRTIFHTMYDHPTLGFNLDLLRRELRLMPRIGMEYYQVFPGVFDWVQDDPKPSDVRDVVRHANRQGVRIGDYSGTSSVFCTHYNEYGNTLDKPEWRIIEENGSPSGAFCFGCCEFADYYGKTVADNCRKYGFDLHCLDFLAIRPCHATNHGHPASAESVYQQVLGMTRVVQAINEVSPEMMTWPNSGNWQAFLPKLAWYTPNLYLTDPFIDKPWQGLNSTRIMDDVRRDQMVRLHYTHFLPYRFFTNCQYFFCQNSIVPDIRDNYEYGALATLAVTPNLCLAEVRPWMDSLTPVELDRVKAFYTKWTSFLKKHFDLWTKTYAAGENPGPGAVEIYGHAKGSHGFVFVVNPNYWGRTVEVPLDGSLGFDGQGQCEIEELYPVERLRLTPQGPLAKYGSKTAVHVPAQQVLVLEVRPAPKTVTKPRLYGLPGTVEPNESGYLVKTTGPQGATERFAILLPPDASPISSAEVRPDVPKQPKRAWEATPIRMMRSGGKESLFEITFRRPKPPTELREWRAKPGTISEAGNRCKGFADGEALSFPLFADAEGVTPPVWDDAANALNLGPLASFCGGYVDNAFSERQVTWIDLRTDGKPASASGGLATSEVAARALPIPDAAKSAERSWWVQTTFSLPFTYGLGMEPQFKDHTILALPFLRRAEVKNIRGWINGVPLDVRDYRYPRNTSFGCYWADLVGSGAHFGDNTLVVYFEAGG
jgi:hypothetical protein